MKREIIQTADGSTTIHLPDWDESYHSKFGAVQEAQHVFLANGFDLFKGQPVCILEVGFGTGLNAFLTYIAAVGHNQTVDYVGVEAYPVAADEVLAMNYAGTDANNPFESIFEQMHQCPWAVPVPLSPHFTLTKRQQFFDAIADVEQFDLIYFDAFGYRVQPELWSLAIFERMYRALKPKGVLVTYAARGVIKRNMQQAGFSVEKLAGPPGKREMFRARKG